MATELIAFGGIQLLKHFPVGVHYLFKGLRFHKWNICSQEIKSSGSCDQTISQIWTTIGLFSHSAVQRLPGLITPAQPFVGCRVYFLIGLHRLSKTASSQWISHYHWIKDVWNLQEIALHKLKNIDTETESFGQLPNILTVDNSKDMVTFSMLYFACSLKVFWPWLILSCYWKQVLQFNYWSRNANCWAALKLFANLHTL